MGLGEKPKQGLDIAPSSKSIPPLDGSYTSEDLAFGCLSMEDSTEILSAIKKAVAISCNQLGVMSENAKWEIIQVRLARYTGYNDFILRHKEHGYLAIASRFWVQQNMPSLIYLSIGDVDIDVNDRRFNFNE